MCQMFAGQPSDNYEYQTRSMRLNGMSTSLRLEQKFWEILDLMAVDEGVSTPQFVSTLHSEVISLHGEARNFTSLLRCTCLIYQQNLVSALDGSKLSDKRVPASA